MVEKWLDKVTITNCHPQRWPEFTYDSMIGWSNPETWGNFIASLNQSSDHCANLAPPCFAPKFPMGLGLDISDILDVEQQVQDGFL